MRVFLRRSLPAALLLGTVLTLQASDALDETQRLAGLCKVWGLLKYYHPDVATGTIDWDEALIEAIPRVQAVQTRDDLNHEFMVLVRTAGLDLPPGPAAGAIFPRSVFGWLDDQEVFDPVVAAYLKVIVTGNQPAKTNRYANPVKNVGNPDFNADRGGYSLPEYPDEAHRLLALFRYWNMVQYFFPNRDIMDCNWEEELARFAPRFADARDATEYHLAFAELVAKITDTHAGVYSSTLWNHRGLYTVPVRTRFIQGQTAITQVFPRLLGAGIDLRVGDVITQIDGVPTETVRARLRKTTSGSNADSLEYRVDQYLLGTNAASLPLTVTRDSGPPAMVTANTVSWSAYNSEVSATRDPTVYRFIDSDVGYVSMGVLLQSQVASTMDALMSTRAIVFDDRAYPNNTLYLLAQYLKPASTPFVKFMDPDYAHPGSVVATETLYSGPSQPTSAYYKGRVVILLDESTISHAEFTAMCLRTAPDATVIGSRTSGADGNVSSIYMPGGLTTGFSGIVPLYPDGRPTQRVGIVPDIEVRPTIAGVRDGRDEVLEAALAFINRPPTNGGSRASPSTSRDRRPDSALVRLRDKRDR